MSMGKGDRASRPDSMSFGMRFRGPSEPVLLKTISPVELPGRIVLVETPKGRKRFLITAPRVREGRPGFSAIAVDSKGSRLDDNVFFLPDVVQAKLIRRRKLELGELRAAVSSRATGKTRSGRGERTPTGDTADNRPEENVSVFDHYASHVDSDKDGRSSVNDLDEIEADNIDADLAGASEPDDDQDDLPPGFQRADD